MNIINNIKHMHQRIKKGYSFRDVYSMDEWFLTVIPNMIKDLNETKFGYPMSVTNEEWEEILNRIIFCFRECDEKTCSIKNEYKENYHKAFFGEFSKEKTLNGLLKINFPEVPKELEDKYMNRCNEIEKYRENMKNEGFDLLKKYFWNLWD